MSEQTGMRGRVCLVTGATDGIGLATAQALAARGATVVLAGRNPVKAGDARARITEATGNDRVSTLLADLSIMDGVRKLAADFRCWSITRARCSSSASRRPTIWSRPSRSITWRTTC